MVTLPKAVSTDCGKLPAAAPPEALALDFDDEDEPEHPASSSDMAAIRAITARRRVISGLSSRHRPFPPPEAPSRDCGVMGGGCDGPHRWVEEWWLGSCWFWNRWMVVWGVCTASSGGALSLD